MCIRRSLCLVLGHPDDGDDNPKARRRGFGSFASIHDPEDRDWETRVLPLDPPPVAIHLPHEADAWTDPDGEDESHAEEVDIRAELRVMQHDLYSLEIG